MLRVRRNSTAESLFVESVKEDGFIVRYKGQNHLEVLKDFLKNRRENVKDNYPKKDHIVLFELNLYEEILNRVIKGLEQKLLT
jgi:hypothetical protein